MRKTLNPLINQFELYKQTLPKDLSDKDLADAKHNFYSGMILMFGLVTDIPDDTTDKEMADALQAMQDQLGEYVKTESLEYFTKYYS